jgi:glyoxylase-like metal-dependent hydrolase (beta-lactamase superfamily II)
MKKALWIVSSLVALAMVAAFNAPTLYFEQFVWRHGAVPVVGPIPKQVAGHWVDDYFVVESIDDVTFAIGEPRYYQGNYSYLLIGKARALLFDAGSGLRDITPVVRSLTSLPVTVLPSHLHFDHVGALGRFERTALPDDPTLRARVSDDHLTLTRYEFLGAMDRLQAPRFRVDDWWADGYRFDLGGRIVEILSTPGHTPTSVSVWDMASARLFVGDYMYPGELYAFLPGASLSAYEATANRLLALLPRHVRLYAAHMQEAPAIPSAPVMVYDDLLALRTTLSSSRQGGVVTEGAYPRIYPVAGPMTLATGLPWNLR